MGTSNNVAAGLFAIGRGLGDAAAIPEMKDRLEQRKQELALNEQRIEAAKQAFAAGKQEMASSKLKTMGSSYQSIEPGARGDFLSAKEAEIEKLATDLNVNPADIKLQIKDAATRFERRKSIANTNLEALAVRMDNWAPQESAQLRLLSEELKDIKGEEELDKAIKSVMDQSKTIFQQAASIKTVSARQQQVADTREIRIEKEKSDELFKMQDRFNKDKVVQKTTESGEEAARIIALVDSDSPIAAGAVPTFMARASGEVGNLSEADKAPFGGTRALVGKIAQVAETAKTGRLTEENKKFVRELAGLMQRHSQEVIDRRVDFFANQFSKSSRFVKDKEEIRRTLLPDTGSSSGEKDVMKENANQRRAQIEATIKEIDGALQIKGLDEKTKKELLNQKSLLSDQIK